MNPVPPPFNPIGTAAAGMLTTNTTHNTDTNSVVSDLMRVYESLTQSSTPQNQQQHQIQQPDGTYTSNNIDLNSAQCHPFDFSQPAEQQQQQAVDAAVFNSYVPTWTYDTTSVPSYNENTYPPMATVVAAPILSAAPLATDANINNSSNNSVGSRSLRKRSAPTSLDDSSSGDNNNHTATSAQKNKTRRKNKDTDGRWSKRFTWPEDLHRDFVSAVFDVGLKHSSPSTVMEHMPKHAQITSERVKSHLQKYRLHRHKSKKDFMTAYDSSMSGLEKDGLAGVQSLSGGHVPAHLTYLTLNDTATGELAASDAVDGKKISQRQAAASQAKRAAAPQQPQDALVLPRLTEQEKQSPIGASMGYLMGLFFSLKQQLVAQRAAQAAAVAVAKKNQPVAAVFDSFVNGLPANGQADGDGQANMTQPAVVPSTRNNLEESNMMKREMKNQMAFRNKMRALKMQELNKCKTLATTTTGAGEEGHGDHEEADGGAEAKHVSIKAAEATADDEHHQHFQGAGEPAADGGLCDSRPRIMSFAASDDFWNTDVVDDQLFEFLMNN
jgi:SHAQKYF class myb-like DNA-binding protein